MNVNSLLPRSIRPLSVSFGKFAISPVSHRTDTGAYQAAVTVSSGHGSSSRHRIYRFSRHHATPEAARLVALTQGWLHTCDPSPAMC
jgi:hypothetical protein